MARLVVLGLLVAIGTCVAQPVDIKLTAEEQISMRNQLPEWPVNPMLLQAIPEATLRFVAAQHVVRKLLHHHSSDQMPGWCRADGWVATCSCGVRQRRGCRRRRGEARRACRTVPHVP